MARARSLFEYRREFAEIPCTRVENHSEIALGRAMAVLDGQTRNLCQLIAVEGYAYDEVSTRVKIPLGSIGAMYIRAKA